MMHYSGAHERLPADSYNGNLSSGRRLFASKLIGCRSTFESMFESDTQPDTVRNNEIINQPLTVDRTSETGKYRRYLTAVEYLEQIMLRIKGEHLFEMEGPNYEKQLDCAVSQDTLPEVSSETEEGWIPENQCMKSQPSNRACGATRTPIIGLDLSGCGGLPGKPSGEGEGIRSAIFGCTGGDHVKKICKVGKNDRFCRPLSRDIQDDNPSTESFISIHQALKQSKGHTATMDLVADTLENLICQITSFGDQSFHTRHRLHYCR
ncbi:hypothetical protein J6590_034058 [Homalodisca vitripennis]|nr:hypothetical protein J6590_034058 [Homalodisca vitripennis]